MLLTLNGLYDAMCFLYLVFLVGKSRITEVFSSDVILFLQPN